MSAISPIYANPFATTQSSLKSLANGSAVCLNIFNPAVMRAVDIHLAVDLYIPGAVSTTGYLSICMLQSHDGSKWGSSGTYTTYAALNTAMTTGAILSNVNQISNIREILTIPTTHTYTYWADYVGRYVGTLPPYMALLLVNNSGAATDATYTHTVSFTPVSYEYA